MVDNSHAERLSVSPLTRRIEQLLRAGAAPLAIAEIQRQLRQTGNPVSEGILKRALESPSLFVVAPDGRWTLRSRLSEFMPPAENESPSLKVRDTIPEEQLPLLRNLPRAHHDYVVLDLEATGLTASEHRIIQIVAIRVRDGNACALLSRRCSPGDIELSDHLMRTLGFLDRPDVWERTKASPPFTEIADDVRSFLGDLPIVAHNARFDAGFLCQHLSGFANPVVDSLELAHLVAPELTSHKLSDIATALGATYEQASALATLLHPGGSDHVIGAETLHDALTDTCLLTLAYRRMLDLLSRHDEGGHMTSALLPEIRGERWRGAPPDIRAFMEANAPALPESRLANPPVLLHDAGEQTIRGILEQFRLASSFRERPGQTEMALAIHHAFEDERFSLLEAPTGTGKSIAYLIPAVVHAASRGERVLLSTAYKTLQEQLLGDIERLVAATSLDIRVQTLTGLGNELCRDRMIRAITELDERSSLDDRYLLAVTVQWLIAHPDATIDQFPFWLRQTFPGVDHLLDELSAANSGCHNAICQVLGCAAWRRAELAKGAHLLVVNHALWLADPDRLPDATRLVVDEAHTLEDVATTALTEESSLILIRRVLRKLVDKRTGRGLLVRIMAGRPPTATAAATRKAIDAAEVVDQLARGYGDHLQRFVRLASGKGIDRRYGATFRLETGAARIAPTIWPDLERASAQLYRDAIGDLLSSLDLLQRQLQSDQREDWDARPVQTDLSRIADDLIQQQKIQLTVIEARFRHDVHWIALEPQPVSAGDEEEQPADDDFLNRHQASVPLKNWAFRRTPIRVDRALQERYAEFGSVVFVSATLSLGASDFRFFRERLGLQDLVAPDDQRVIPAALNYAQNAFLGLIDFLEHSPSQRTIESFQSELAKELAQFLPYVGGRSLGLFTSRARLEKVRESLRAPMAEAGIPLLAQGDAVSRSMLLDNFRADESSVLFGLRSYWEGVDVPGRSLSFVLMEKLPFPALFDPVSSARRQDVQDRGGHEFDDYLFPLMALQFKQGFGRLLRREDDRGAVLLYDKRIHRKSYLLRLLAALPGFVPRESRNERDRRRLYEALAAHLPELIDLTEQREFLESLPSHLLTDLEERLVEWQVPDRVAYDDYPLVQDRLMTALKELFRFDSFRSEAQEAAIRQILAGKDVIALLPTGGGKSLCFQLTAFVRPGITIVISPLIALMRDQVQNLLARGIEFVGAMVSGQRADEREETLGRVRRGRIKLLYVSPERLRDPALIDALAHAQITQIVVDEAHCVVTWGPQFRPDFLRINRLIDRLPNRPPIAAFTATATPEMRSEIARVLKLEDHVDVVASFDRPELRFVVANSRSVDFPVRTKRDRLGLLIRILQAADRDGASSLVYVSTTVEADLLARRLRAMGFATRAYHGKLDTLEREVIQDLFMDDQIKTIVCTKAFGMGIDKPDIRYVIHAQMPGDLESYFQEAGRAGRDGNPAYCILIPHASDERIHQFFIDQAAPDFARIEALFRAVRRQASTHKVGGWAVLDVDDLVEESGLDETQVTITLHRLEEALLLERGDNVTLQAAITLRDHPTEIARHLEETNRDAATLFRQVAAIEHWESHQRAEITLNSLAAQLCASPEGLDQLFHELAGRDLILYRPWRHGISIRFLNPATNELSAQVATQINDPRAAMHEKLATMNAYASIAGRSIKDAQGRPACRRATILRYFGQEPPSARCGVCDLCQPDASYPWSSLSARDVAGVADFFDPAFTILETIAWNEDRLRRGRSPYSLKTLQKILLGDAWGLTQFNTDPTYRKARLAALRSCPFWGVFEALTNGESRLVEISERLSSDGYIVVANHVQGNDRSWPIPTLTHEAVTRLESGETFTW